MICAVADALPGRDDGGCRATCWACAPRRWACPPTRSAALARHPTWTFNINRYPPLTEVGEPLPGQFRIGPHTDFGTVTVLDREPGAGGLQVDIDGLAGWTRRTTPTRSP